MYHDTGLAHAARPTAADPRPPSAVSHGVGLAGLAGLVAWVLVAHHYGFSGPNAALANLLACAIPMIAWSLLVDKVHRRASTGIDWAAPRPWLADREVSIAKLVGLWATWAGMAAIYLTGRFYWEGSYAFAMSVFAWGAAPLALVSIPYVLWLDRYLVEPRDDLWAFGAWLLGRYDGEPRAIHDHLRAWAVKTMFLAFMLAVVPQGYGQFVGMPWQNVLADPVALANWLITFMFLLDVAFATVGYMLTLRPLDAQIRSANPYMAGWTAALICYPPFIMMDGGRPFDYRPGTADWVHWMQGHPTLLAFCGAVLVALTAVYAWSTMAFGVRFSNLTHRGILTHGPYALSRHPAYLSKNLFWWLSTLPFLTTGTLVDAARATVLLGVVSAIYWWRAKTEERHLSADPAYREYSEWMARRGAVPRLFRWMRSPDPSPAEPLPAE